MKKMMILAAFAMAVTLSACCGSKDCDKNCSKGVCPNKVECKCCTDCKCGEKCKCTADKKCSEKCKCDTTKTSNCGCKSK